MTFCLGMIVNEGIVAIADSRLTSGNEIISAKKVSVYQQFFRMWKMFDE